MNRTLKCIMLQSLLLALIVSMGEKAYAQNSAVTEKAKKFAALDSLILNLKEFGQFRIRASSELSVEMADAYRNLFMPDVWVYDNYNPERDPGNSNRPKEPYKGSLKKIEDFVADVKRFYPKGMTVKLSAINVDFSALDQDKVKYVIRRETSLTDYGGSRLTTTEEFMLMVQRDPASGKYKIYEWRDLKHEIKCANCEETFAKTVDPADDPKMRLKTWAQLNANVGMGKLTTGQLDLSNLNQETYDQLISSRSRVGAFQKSDVKSAILIDGEVEMLYGHSHQIGLGVGISWSSFNAELSMDSTVLEYRTQDFNNSEWNRIVRFSDYKENITTSVISVPVLLRYTKRVNEKFKLHVAVGPTISIQGKIKSEVTGSGDFELMGYTKSVSNDTLVFNANPGGQSASSAPLTERFFESRVDVRDWQVADYDIGFNQNLKGDREIVTDLSIGWLARLSCGYMINNTTEITGGFSATGAKLSWKEEKVSIADKVSDKDNAGSLLNGSANLQNMNYYICAGIRMYLTSGMKTKLK